jgi:hypothetical protein
VEIGTQAFIESHSLLGVTSGTEANGGLITYPTVDFKVDGASGELPQVPLLDKILTQPYHSRYATTNHSPPTHRQSDHLV